MLYISRHTDKFHVNPSSLQGDHEISEPVNFMQFKINVRNSLVNVYPLNILSGKIGRLRIVKRVFACMHERGKNKTEIVCKKKFVVRIGCYKT